VLGPSVAIRAFAGVCGAVAVAIALPAGALEGPYVAISTRVAVKLSERLSSQEAHSGQTFAFETTSSVALDGLFLAAGTHGHGVVVTARAARGPHPGELRLAARTLDIGNGRTLAVGLEPGQLERTLAGDARGFPVPVGGAPVYVGSARSTNVVFERGTPFIVVAPPPETVEATPAAG
jgi:hypothetical protein